MAKAFLDGEVVITFSDGSEQVESFENCGKELDIDIEPDFPWFKATNVKIRLTNARVEP
jgi:hypothetical protein